MKKHYILFTALVAASLTISMEKSSELIIQKNKVSHQFSSGGQAALTGAPGEANCTQCHVGSTVDGTTQNILTVLSGTTPVTSYVPGQSYTIGLSLNSSPAKKGFSSTVLSGTNMAAGTFTGAAIGGTQDFSSGGREYVSHTSASNTSSTPAWAWTWVAPATNVGAVTFYVASNEANNNGTTAGDKIYLSTHTIGSTVGLEEVANAKVQDFNASFSAENSTIYMSYSSLINGTTSINVIDMTGKSVFTANLDNTKIGLNKDMVYLPENVRNGMYVVNFFVDNTPSSKTISVQR